MKKSRFFSAAIFAAIGLSLIGCSDGDNGGSSSGNHQSEQAELKVNLSNISYLATQWVRPTRAAEDSESLVAVDDEGKVVEKQIIQLPEALSNVKLSTVREVYRNDKGEDKAKGTYVVFEWYLDNLTGSDGNNYYIGQVQFISDSDGKVYDIFNQGDNVNRIANSWHKEYSGKDYIKFDNSGNIYMLGKENPDTSYEKQVIFKWNPLTAELKTFELKGKEDVSFQLFDVNAEGSWIFAFATYGQKNGDLQEMSGVFGFNTNNGNAAPVTYYESTLESQKYRYPVKGLAVDNKNTLIFYINGFYAAGREDAGLFMVPKSSAGYVKEKMTRYFSLGWHDLWMYVLSMVEGKNIHEYDDGLKYELTVDKIKAANLDYEKILNYIKSFCNDKNVDFTLEYFKGKDNIPLIFGEGNEWQIDANKYIYEPAEADDAVKNEAALKFLFETKSDEIFMDDNRDPKGDCLFMNEFYLFTCGAKERQEYNVDYSPMFLELFLVDKTNPTKKTYETTDLTFMKSKYAKQDNFLFITNDTGTWIYNDINTKIGDDEYEPSHANLVHLFNLNEAFSENDIPGLADIEFYASWDKLAHEPTDPWKKMPFQSNTNGIAAISKDQKTVYYITEDEVIDLLADDPNKTIVDRIYCISLSDTTLMYNGTKRNGGHVTVSIDLNTREAEKLAFTQQLESMIKVK